jgi:hypothetical protein
MSPQLELSTFLDAIRKRWRWLVALRAGTSALVGAALAFGLLAAIFRIARPNADVLLVLTLLAAAAAIGWMVRALRPMLGAPDDRRLARFVEERRPEFQDALVTAVHVRDGEHAFARAILADAAIQAREVEPGSIVRRDELQRAAGRGAVACALLLVTGGASVEPLARALAAARVRLFPSRIVLAVEPGHARIVAGRSLTLRARLTGVPEDFDPSPTVTLQSGTGTDRQAMRRDGASFTLTLPGVTRSFKYGVTAAGVTSAEFEVTVLHRPALQRIDVAYEYPAYTGLAARVEEDSGDVYAPAGTRVTLRVRSDKRLTSATLRMGSRDVPLREGRDPQMRETSFVVQRDGSYRVALTDSDGLQGDPSSEYFVRVTDDRPPEIRILRPEQDRKVTPLEEVEIAAQADDDYRLGPLELVYAVGAQPEKVVALNRGGGSSAAGGHLLFLEDLKVRPGDMVRAYARVREARPGGRETRSDMLLLEVSPFDQEFSLAQSQAMGGGNSGGDLDSLVQAQKHILNATWNLLRRATAGRSDADLNALASAQGELRGRTQSQGGRVGRGGDDPMKLAATAMGRAEEALKRRRLQDAVPHEMEALTQLGRALAENRRRQVSQQRGQGGGGGNRSSQDLSALFDRELLRQQQTNYENRQSSSNERRDENAESELQKRIRELAQRQDELARAQRQLAAQRLSEEERRRQLERLTREQEELRQQAEQLARDLQRQQKGEQSREQSQDVRDAAEEMRGSSNEMRRDNAQSASQRGSRAADRLRGAEQPSGGAQGQQQSLGELQMEAQQLADAQRRIEAQQQGESEGRRDRPQPGAQAGNGSRAEEARRLSDEQARLADRAERLERSARGLAGSRGEQQRGRQAAEQAARELQRGRVAERMRENARQLGRGDASERSESTSSARQPGAAQQEQQQQQQPGGTPQDGPQQSGQPQGQQQGSQQPGSQQQQAGGQQSQQGREGSPSQSGQPQSQSQSGRVSSTLDRVAERLSAAGDAETRRLANELARNRAARERLEEAARRLERAQREGDPASQGELREETQRAERMLRELQQGGRPDSGFGESTPEQHEWSRSAPGLESFKQDFSRWEQLKRDITLALERRDLALARQLRGKQGDDKVNAGSVEALPESYRAKVARYFEMLARAGRRNP